MDFGHLEKLNVKGGDTAPFTFYDVVGEPVLHLSPANESNKPYFNALLKRSRKNQRRLQKNNFTAEVIEENREDDRVLYPRFIIKVWDKVVDADGNPAEFNHENVCAFLAALPNWLFDQARTFAVENSNFVEDLVDVEEVAGNLP